MDKQSKEQESKNRIDSIIALILEEARTLKNIEGEASRIYHVLIKVQVRVMEIIETRRK